MPSHNHLRALLVLIFAALAAAVSYSTSTSRAYHVAGIISANTSTGRLCMTAFGQGASGAASALIEAWDCRDPNIYGTFIVVAPRRLTDLAMVTYANTFYFIGGRDGNTVSNNFYVMYHDGQQTVVDFASSPELAVGRAEHAAVVYNGVLVVAGGRNYLNQTTPEIEVFNVSMSPLSRIASSGGSYTSLARSYMAAAVAGGLAGFAYGTTTFFSGGTCNTELALYDFATNTLVSRPLGDARCRGVAAASVADRYMIFSGGLDANDMPISRTTLYDVIGDAVITQLDVQRGYGVLLTYSLPVQFIPFLGCSDPGCPTLNPGFYNVTGINQSNPNPLYPIPAYGSPVSIYPARRGAAAFIDGSTAYITNGVDVTGIATNSVYTLSLVPSAEVPTTAPPGTSQTIPPPPTTVPMPLQLNHGRILHAAAYVTGTDGKLYCAVGFGVDIQNFPLNSMEYWECLSASAPTLVSADITGRALPAASGIGGRILWSGGRDSQGKAIGSVYSVNPALPSDAVTVAMPTPRYAHGSVAVGNILVLGSGQSDQGNVDSMDILDTVSMTWVTVTQPNLGRDVYGSVASTGVFVAFGGGCYNDFGVVGTIYNCTDRIDVYDFVAKQWTIMSLDTPRCRPVAAASGPYIVFSGGYDRSGTPSDSVTFIRTPSLVVTHGTAAPIALHALPAFAKDVYALYGCTAQCDLNMPPTPTRFSLAIDVAIVSGEFPYTAANVTYAPQMAVTISIPDSNIAIVAGGRHYVDGQIVLSTDLIYLSAPPSPTSAATSAPPDTTTLTPPQTSPSSETIPPLATSPPPPTTAPALPPAPVLTPAPAPPVTPPPPSVTPSTSPDGTLIISGPVYISGNFTAPGVVLYDGSGAVIHVNGTVQVQGTAVIQIGASDAGGDTQRRVLIDSTSTMTGTFSDVSVTGQWRDAKSGRCYTYWVAKQEQQHNSLSVLVVPRRTECASPSFSKRWLTTIVICAVLGIIAIAIGLAWLTRDIWRQWMQAEREEPLMAQTNKSDGSVYSL